MENLTEEFVTSEVEVCLRLSAFLLRSDSFSPFFLKVLELLNRGEKQRSTSATGMNETSSRSHSLFVLTVIQRLKGILLLLLVFFSFLIYVFSKTDLRELEN